MGRMKELYIKQLEDNALLEANGCHLYPCYPEQDEQDKEQE